MKTLGQSSVRDGSGNRPVQVQMRTLLHIDRQRLAKIVVPNGLDRRPPGADDPARRFFRTGGAATGSGGAAHPDGCFGLRTRAGRRGAGCARRIAPIACSRCEGGWQLLIIYVIRLVFTY